MYTSDGGRRERKCDEAVATTGPLNATYNRGDGQRDAANLVPRARAGFHGTFNPVNCAVFYRLARRDNEITQRFRPKKKMKRCAVGNAVPTASTRILVFTLSRA